MNMTAYRVGIIGCGRPWKSEGASGFGMGHAHARGYAASPEATIVALADLSEENARAFQAEHGGEQIYQDYREMLAHAKLDIVSICTWPHLHAEMVIAAAEAGVKAIHCEKPMAPTFGEARRMAAACQQHGAQLTFNHQRRFGKVFQKARRAAAIRRDRPAATHGGDLPEPVRLGHALVRHAVLLQRRDAGRVGNRPDRPARQREGLRRAGRRPGAELLPVPQRRAGHADHPRGCPRPVARDQPPDRQRRHDRGLPGRWAAAAHVGQRPERVAGS